MTGDRPALLATVVASRRRLGAEREHAAFEAFRSEHGLTPSPDAVTLYLTSLLDSGRVHGRGLRYRLHLLDLRAKIAGEPVPSEDQDLRRFLRGLHREASLASPERGVDPLHRETLHAVVGSIARPRRQQLRDAALLSLAHATGLPARVLSELRWDHVRIRRDELVVDVPPMPGRGPRPYSPLAVPAAGGRICPRERLLAWRREAGPAQQPVFSLDGRPCDVHTMQPVLAMLGPPPRGEGIGRARNNRAMPPLVEGILAPRPQAVRDGALLLVAFWAALGTDEARRLLQGDVQLSERGLLLRLPGRHEPWIAIPSLRTGAPCPVAAWRDWQGLLASRGLADPELPAFTQIAGMVVRNRPLSDQGLNLVVQQACEGAALRGDWSFTSLRTGFIRTAIRAGAPKHVVGRQAGLSALHSVAVHAGREMLVRQNAASRVGL